jgi:hypothetical protein
MALKFAINNSLSAITTLPSSISGGALNLISTQTASASAYIEFTSGIDSTYDSYVFKFINIHPATDAQTFQFNLSTDGGSTYNVTKTSTWFQSFHNEADSSTGLSYENSYDLAQSTSEQPIVYQVGNGNDEQVSGMIQLFNPASTTFVKHFIGRCSSYYYTNGNLCGHFAGYGNTTSAVDAVRFKMSSGNIDDGIIKLYGVK